MPRYQISLEVTEPSPPVDVGALLTLADRVMTGESVAEATALAILVTSDDEVREMNHRFLGIDEPTDVLAFPDEAGDFVQGISDEVLLGDIAIALPTAERQADAVGHALDAELAHLLVHGILHLCGYDHVAGAPEESRMRAREEHYLGAISHEARS